MAKLSVTLPEVMNGRRQAVLSGSIIDGDTETRETFSLQEGATKNFDLPDGDYTVQLSLPSGRSVARGVRISDDQPGSIQMGPAEGTVPKWLAWSKLSGDVPRRRYQSAARETDLEAVAVHTPNGWTEAVHTPNGETKLIWHDVEPRETPELEEQPGFDPKEGIWQRLLEFRDGQWQELDWTGNGVTTDGVRWKFSVYTNFGQLLAVQSGGLDVPWRSSLVPPGGAEILIQRGDLQDEAQRGLQTVVISEDLRAQTLLSYLAQGDYVSLMTVGEEMIKDAETMLFSKVSDPMGAAVGGYFLLLSENYEQLHNWPNNFANWIDWLPDSAILHGWQLMKQPGAQDPGAALERFLEAVKRGIPVFTMGLRYLYDALDYANRRLPADDVSKADVQIALDRVTGWAQAADWTRTYTTLFGASLEKPNLLSRSGLPWNWRGVQFLPEIIDPDVGQTEVSERYPLVTTAGNLLARATVAIRPEGQSWTVTLQRVGNDDSIYSGSSFTEALKEARKLAAQFAPSRLVLFDGEQMVERFDIFDLQSHEYSAPSRS